MFAIFKTFFGLFHKVKLEQIEKKKTKLIDKTSQQHKCLYVVLHNNTNLYEYITNNQDDCN